jgi:DNA methylase
VKSAPANYTWNTQFTPYEQEYINRSYDGTDPNGRKFTLSDTAGPGGAAKGNPKYEFLGVTRYWRYSKEKMEELYKQGRIVQTKPGNVPRYKRYLDEMKGVELQDILTDIKPVGTSREDLGYPTQKPELLLERIIKTSSNPMDIVFDPFCGCGTATAVAHRLGRRWIGIDISPTACELMRKRMISLGARHFVVMGMPMTEKELRKIDHFEFQNWVIQWLFGRISQRKSSDMGIDGYTFEGTPIQVKQSDDVGRNVIDNFQTALRRANSNEGVIVAFSFGRRAYEEIARCNLRDGLTIKAITINDLLSNIGSKPTDTHF